MTPDLLAVMVRAVGFVALFQAAGATFFLAIFGGSVHKGGNPIRNVVLVSAASGALLILVHLGLDAARLSGDFQGLWDGELQRLAWTDRSGISQIVQVIGLIAVLAAQWKPERSRARWASVGAVIAVGGFLITGHTSNHPLRPILAPLLAVHLFVVAFWFGSLAPLALVSHFETRATAAGVLRQFSALASWLVPLILVAGLMVAWLLAGSLDVLRRPYGELLIAKLVGFALLMVFAAYNKWWVVPVFETAPSKPSLRRSLAAEYVLIVAVLATTAVLTTFYSPE